LVKDAEIGVEVKIAERLDADRGFVLAVGVRLAVPVIDLIELGFDGCGFCAGDSLTKSWSAEFVEP